MSDNLSSEPEYLDHAFIQRALVTGMKNPCLKIVDYKLSAATLDGDNYGSRMLRASSIIKKQVNDREENLSFIIKLLPQGQYSDTLISSIAFQKEGKMYCDILPELNILLRKAYPNDEPISALCYGYETSPEPVLFLEDLKVPGYEKGHRFQRSDWPKIKLVLRTLAKYHASSYVFIQDKPDVKEFFKESVWDRKRSEFIDVMMKNTFQDLARLVSTWENSSEKERYRNKLENLAAKGAKKNQEYYVRDDNTFNVLLHGDCWMNNYMFKYDENGEAAAVKLVDMQIVTFNTPVLDIIHFIFSSTSHDVWLGDPDDFLSYYHECFTTTIKNLDFNLERSFTLEDLRKEYFKRLFYGVTMLYFIYPRTVLPQNEVQTESGSYKHKDDVVSDMLRKAMPFFENHGVL